VNGGAGGELLTPDFGKSDVIGIVKQSVVGILGQSTNLEANMLLKLPTEPGA